MKHEPFSTTIGSRSKSLCRWLGIKQKLRERYYLRYCDDFIILSNNEKHLKDLIILIQEFLRKKLHLELHPNKLTIRKLSQGIDFVGYVLFSKYKLVRSRTKQRMKKRLAKGYTSYLQGTINDLELDQQLQSYLGILSHSNQHELSQTLKNAYLVRKPKL
jgi:RNA-directed DNA polymerase